MVVLPVLTAYDKQTFFLVFQIVLFICLFIYLWNSPLKSKVDPSLILTSFPFFVITCFHGSLASFNRIWQTNIFSCFSNCIIYLFIHLFISKNVSLWYLFFSLKYICENICFCISCLQCGVRNRQPALSLTIFFKSSGSHYRLFNF